MTGFEDTGLRGVNAATTHVSMVDGEAGKLLYRGFNIEDLARESSYEEVVYLLIHDRMPNLGQLWPFYNTMVSNRALPTEIIECFMKVPVETPPMSVMQAGVSLLASQCRDLEDESREANERRAIQIVSSLPTMAAAWMRISRGLKPVKPDEELSTAANFLYMVNDRTPDPIIAHFMDVLLILHAEHSFNASTFTARVVASTRANMYSAMSAGIGSLSGSLHGGANAQVMKNLQDTHELENVEEWVEQRLRKGHRISGMGHAVYKTMDPRACILHGMAKSILTGHPGIRWVEMTERMAAATQGIIRKMKGKEIHPNMDLYSAAIYHAMGIQPEFYPCIFAMARSAGWAAHILEEKFPRPPVKRALYRPSSTYIGEVDRPYVSIEHRGPGSHTNGLSV